MPRDIQLRQNGDIQLRVLHQPTTPLDLSLDVFITAKEAERCTPRTIETYRFSLERFGQWLSAQNVADAARITPHHIRLFLVSLEKQGCAAGYIHIYARVIKTWLRFLHAEELITTNPMDKVATAGTADEVVPRPGPKDTEGMAHILAPLGRAAQ